MSDVIKNEELVFDDSEKLNNNGQVILGKLKGPCADFICSTRNGRKYDESLWEKVFSDPIINEYIECGGIPGELDHPADRTETCSEKIAIMMPEKPKKDKSGKLIATFDILNTPTGRIVATLAKYGYKLGISSRGSGDTYMDTDGSEHVDEDSYDFKAFDVVLLPAVKSARMEYISESFDVNRVSFRKAINEALETASDDDKKIMTETLSNLNIDITSEKSVDNIDVNMNTETAVNDGVAVISDLQEALKEKQTLEAQITTLQEKLSVSYAKEATNEEQIAKYKKAIGSLTESSKNAEALKQKVTSLESQLKERSSIISNQGKRIASLEETITSANETRSTLNESLTSKDSQIRSLQEKLVKITNVANQTKADNDKEVSKLNESIAELKKDSAIKNSEYSRKLAKANELVERYKKIAQAAVDRYITSQAIRLGISATEIKNKLTENYSFNDIDKVCESLQEYKVKLGKLPFNLAASDATKIRMKVTESKEPIDPAGRLGKSNVDEVDSQLRNLAGI